SLPDDLQRELDVPGLRHHELQTSSAARSSVLIEYLGLAGAKEGQRRPKVGVVQDVEKLCPELHAGALRNLPHREVLVDRKIQVNEPRTDNAIAAGIAQEIRATARNRRKRHALRCDRRSGHGHPEATGVDVTQPRI